MRQSILQSAAWAEFQRALGKEVIELSGPGFSAVAILETSPLGDSLYTPYGPAADDADALKRALDALAREARSRRLSYVRVEPVTTPLGRLGASALEACGLRPAPHDVQPRDTLIIDVDREEKAILADMRSSNRNIARNIHKKGVTIRTSQDPEDIRHLTGLLEKTAERSEFTAHTHDYLATAARVLMPLDAATLYIAELQEPGSEKTPGGPSPVTIAAALTYDTPETRVYAHAAASDDHRKLSPGLAVVVQLIKDARTRGQKSVDLWGVAPAGAPADHPWSGFTRFKESFGGEPVHYLGSWDLPLDYRYAAYRAVRGARDLRVQAVKLARTRVIPFLKRAAPVA
jgi:lipid II:glycine glycyltransferase (peptidoglycan interpeptide bridge formation enzyme)